MRLLTTLLVRTSVPLDSADAESSEPEVKTQSELDEQLKDLIGYGGQDNKYIEIPNLDLTRLFTLMMRFLLISIITSVSSLKNL